MAALISDADVLLYGGAAGGGKSDLLLGAALVDHRKSIIFRRDFPQLKDLIGRSREIIGDRGQFAGGAKNYWTLPEGRTLEFASCLNEEDKNKFKGRPHDLKGFDEVTEFTETQFRFLVAWNRSVVPGQRCRVICTCNPPTTAAGRWVIRYWAPWLDPRHSNPAQPGDLRWFYMRNGKEIELPPDHTGEPFYVEKELIRPQSRTFIPALLSDNAYLEKTNYRATLQALPEPLRSQMLMGDFRAGMADDAFQVIPTAWVQASMERWSERQSSRFDCIGADVARGGVDNTVIAKRSGDWVAQLERVPGSETPTGQHVAALLAKDAANGGVINVDVIGVGTAAFDAARELGLPVRGVNVATRSEQTDASGLLHFVNLRAELWWNLRDMLDPSRGSALALPPDDALFAELTAPLYTVRSNGIQVESKDDLRERLGRSTDNADAVCLACWQYRPAGSPLLPCLDDVHLLSTGQSILKRRHSWALRRDGLPSKYDCVGHLSRAIWHTRRGVNACVWAHTDEDGCTVVFRALLHSGSLQEFAAEVARLSHDDGAAHNYRADVASSLSIREPKEWENSFIDTLHSQLALATPFFRPALPSWIDPLRIQRAEGLDVLDGLLLGTLGRFHKHPYWGGGEGFKAHQARPMILFATPQVWTELSEARAKPVKDVQDENEEASEDAIAGGGAFCRCLRLLAIEGAFRPNLTTREQVWKPSSKVKQVIK